MYIEGMLKNNEKISRYAIQLTSKGQSTKLSTFFLHELLGIIVGMKATESVCAVNAFAECKSAITRVQEIQREGTKSMLHLTYSLNKTHWSK
jgi:hypothetical protein